MNNKEFTTELAHRLGYTAKDTASMMESLSNVVMQALQEGDTLQLQGFGAFEVKKKMERVVVNPTTKLRMLVPPKLVLNYKPSGQLKDKFK